MKPYVPLRPRPLRAWLSILCVLLAAPQGAMRASDLERGFRDPPRETRPWCYWYWLSDDMTREGITRDLEAMARFGIGEALIGNIFLDDVPAGKVKVLTEEWWSLVEHAIREGGRVGVDIGLFNCPGWSQSGGPWIPPERSMRFLAASETRVRGPARFEGRLPPPAKPFQDVAALAVPAPRGEGSATRGARVRAKPEATGLERMLDGDARTSAALPRGDGSEAVTLEIEFPEAIEARSLSLVPGTTPWAAAVELLAEDAGGAFLPVRSFGFDRSNMSIQVGPMPRGPVTVAFAPAKSRRFRLAFARVSGEASLAEVEVSEAARLESYVEKQLGKMYPTPLPPWDAYLWSTQVEPESPDLVVEPLGVRRLEGALSADGTLLWDVPAGDWILLRIGMTPTGVENAPASPEGRGLEVDKMNHEAARAHFEAFIGRLVERMPAADRGAFKHVVADSYEMGSENWTDGFAEDFRARYGYDPIPWLPALTGRIVGSAAGSDRFLWDLRRLVADRIARDYVGALRDLAEAKGLRLWLENYGHWGFPAEFLQYGGASHQIGGEFWVTGELGSIECRAASSAANTHGMPIVSAEAFTGGPPFQTVPSGLKARGDWAFSEGIQHFVLHVCIHQPREDRKPGVNAWFGTEFNRHNTWFEEGRAWVEYLRRSGFLLSRGTRVADVAYFIGEDTPRMTGSRVPALPPGRDFDWVNAQTLRRLEARDGRVVLPHGASYRRIVLPPMSTLRPEVLRTVRDLVSAGAAVLGLPPTRSPSLEGQPQADEEVRALAAELWGGGDLPSKGERRLGKGRVEWGLDLVESFEAEGLPPDFASGARLRHTHRTSDGAEIYFVANPEPRELATTAAFRVAGRAPELWWPVTGRIERAAAWDEDSGVTRVPLSLGPHGSVFVVFREPSKGLERIVRATLARKTVLDTSAESARAPKPGAGPSAPGAFTMALWVRPNAETTLFAEVEAGVRGISEPRNDALFPPHGQAAFADATAAGCGLAVGTNGICVFEHGANHFVPVLVYPAKIAEWTHVAVVYREGKPCLFVDGRLTREGLRSRFSVRPGTEAPAGGGGTPFQGELGPFETLPRPLGADEIRALRESMPRPGAIPPASAFELSRDADDRLRARFWDTGDWAFELASSKRIEVRVPSIPAALSLAGPWELRLVPAIGSPKEFAIDSLEDLSRHEDEAIRHHSGRAIYRREFELPGAFEGRPVRLELGRVRDLARVRVNGRELGTLWIAPWSIDVTEALRSGKNEVVVEVVNSWNNRLVGDAKLAPSARRSFLAVPTVSKDAPLLPAGLLGPVTLRAAEDRVLE